VVLCLDFDGTLSPIVDDPEAARPLPGVVELLGPLQLPGRPGHPNHLRLLGFDPLDLGVLGRPLQVGKSPPVADHPRVALGHLAGQPLLEPGARARPAGPA
jgi:hypothetical protein